MISETLKNYWSLSAEKQDRMLLRKIPTHSGSGNPLKSVQGRENNTILKKVNRTSPHRLTHQIKS